MNMIFCLQINVKGFFKLSLSFQECLARHGQITQNNKFAISLQYLKEELSDEVVFLHTDKHESLLQIDSIILMGDGQAFPKFPKQQVSNIFTTSQKRSQECRSVFDMQINVKVSASWCYPFWWKWLDVTKIPKIGRWKYFCNILRKLLQLLCVLL